MSRSQKKPIQRRKRCRYCQALFDPDPRSKGQQYACSRDTCQIQRQRQNERDWRKRNPECVAQQRRQTRQWNKTHPEYSHERRTQNPVLLQRNRVQSCTRMRAKREKMRFDKSKLILKQLTDGNGDKVLLSRGGTWIHVRLTKASRLAGFRSLGHNQAQKHSISNPLPKGRLYDLSQTMLHQGQPPP